MHRTHGGGVWSQIYRTQMLRDSACLFQSDIRYSEDVLFTYLALLNSALCIRTDKILYYYRQHQGSTMHTIDYEKFNDSMLKLVYAYDDFYQDEKYSDAKKYSKIKRESAVRALLFNIVVAGDVTRVKSVISDLKRQHLYPYPIRFESLFTSQSVKQLIINTFSLFLPFRFYAVLTAAAIDMLKKIKNKKF